jgi:hypothetical protein
MLVIIKPVSHHGKAGTRCLGSRPLNPGVFATGNADRREISTRWTAITESLDAFEALVEAYRRRPAMMAMGGLRPAAFRAYEQRSLPRTAGVLHTKLSPVL